MEKLTYIPSSTAWWSRMCLIFYLRLQKKLYFYWPNYEPTSYLCILKTNYSPRLWLSFGPKLGNDNLLCAWLEWSVMAAQAWGSSPGKLVSKSLTNVGCFCSSTFIHSQVSLRVQSLHWLHASSLPSCVCNLSYVQCTYSNLKIFDKLLVHMYVLCKWVLYEGPVCSVWTLFWAAIIHA